MGNHEQPGDTYFDQLRWMAGSLVVQHADLVVQHHEIDRVYYPRLHLAAIFQPNTDEARIEPYVIDEPAGFYRLEHDDAAEVEAEPYGVNRKELAALVENRPRDVLWLPKSDKTGAIPILESIEGKKIGRQQLPLNDYKLQVWFNILSASGADAIVEAYDRETDGILRHDIRPNGRRTGPDRIAPWYEIEEHRWQVELSHMNPVGRFIARHLGL